MSKMSKREARAHAEACRILDKQGPLTLDEKWFVLENWREDARHMNNLAGAYFTPVDLARDFSVEVPGGRVLDLCAGIGTLSFMVYHLAGFGPKPEIVCVERNPDYVAVGKRIFPEASWIQADVFNLPSDLGQFDCVISNPPFGVAPRSQGVGRNYKGNLLEYHVLDVAADLGAFGVFILPQGSAPFQVSGVQSFRKTPHERYQGFRDQTGLALEPGCIDTSIHRDKWRGVSPATEVVLCDFAASRPRKDRRADAAEIEEEACQPAF